MTQIKATLIDHMGTDLSVVNAARVSFGKKSELSVEPDVCWGYKTRLKYSDIGLIKYLAKHKHMSPFGHCFASFHIKAPIFVARQLVKHKFLRWNEISRRYVSTEPEFYVPEVWRTKPDGNIKQGSGTSVLPKPDLEVGFCLNCGVDVPQVVRTQSGGRIKKYCSDTCKYSLNNKTRNPYKATYDNVKGRVKRDNKRTWSLPFDTLEFPQYCPYLGLELDYSYGKGGIKPNSPSFDRIDSTKDYIEGNVQIISNRANSMKSDANVPEQVRMAKQVLLMYEGYVVQEDRTYLGHCNSQMKLYKAMIEEGYSAEQARMVLPQSVLTEFYWSGSLDAFSDMCNLRCKDDTQYETRIVADQISEIMGGLYPVSWEALTE